MKLPNIMLVIFKEDLSMSNQIKFPKRDSDLNLNLLTPKSSKMLKLLLKVTKLSIRLEKVKQVTITFQTTRSFGKLNSWFALLVVNSS